MITHWIDNWLVAFPALLCVYVMLCALWQVFRHEARTTLATDQRLPSIAVLIPAHNEEAVIGECLEALLASDHPGMEVHVLSDGSSDGTVEIARKYAGRGVLVHEFVQNQGKSRVLQAGLEQIQTDLVMVLDADTRLDPRALSILATTLLEPGLAGATANIRTKSIRGILGALQSLEYASIIGLLKRANSIWGGLFTVSGAACCFRTAVVRRVGGFESPSITEDIELSWRLQQGGNRLAYVPRALAYVDLPGSLSVLWRQRVRWSQGLTEVLRLHGVRGGCRNLALAIFSVESLLSISWLSLLVLQLIISVSASLWHGDFHLLPRFGIWHALGVSLFLCQTVTASLLDSHYAPLSWRNLPLAVLYPLYFFLIIMPASLVGWTRGVFSRNAGVWERCARVSVEDAQLTPGGPVHP